VVANLAAGGSFITIFLGSRAGSGKAVQEEPSWKASQEVPVA